uniref:AP2/ERF domain-containing protein n=1 Tax=Macrostomum lignano TaxID=282301 RepID=A0A1I8F963_9PLAT
AADQALAPAHDGSGAATDGLSAFPWYQQAGSAQAPPERRRRQHQQQSADVEREFQAAMQFYSRGAAAERQGARASTGASAAPTGVAALQQLRRVDNSTDCWRLRRPTAAIAVDSAAADAASVDFAKRAAAAAGVPSDLGDARGRRPTGSAGPRLVARDARSITGLHNKLVTGLSQPEHPFASHQRAQRRCSRDFAPPQPGSEPSHPDRLELVERAGSGQWRHEVFHLGGPPRHLVWPGDNFDQVGSLNWHFVCFLKIFYFFAWSGNFSGPKKHLLCSCSCFLIRVISGFFQQRQTDRQ